MKRFVGLLGVAMIGLAALPALAQAQVIIVQPGRTYVPGPVFVNPPVVSSSYYLAPSMTPPVTYAPTYSCYGAERRHVFAAAGIHVLGADRGFIAGRYVETRSYYGSGILRPRGWTTETYYRP